MRHAGTAAAGADGGQRSSAPTAHTARTGAAENGGTADGGAADRSTEDRNTEDRGAEDGTARSRAHAELMGLIAGGQLSVGDKLSEVALAARLGVSRNTLREAFAALAADGLVERIPHRGVFVAEPTQREIAEIYRLRILLEAGALQWADGLDTSGLRAIVERGLAARSAGDHVGTAAANQDFHTAIVAAAGSRHADALMRRVSALMRLAFARASRLEDQFHARFAEGNLRVVELLERGDRAGAAASMRAYLDDARAELGALGDPPAPPGR
ncbi:GntR family transcriptional regulator [Brevibacterium sp. BRM-1]|uniref:GntR family transcriptional regulator n=1 Tax=Brevibacterium sp. BRM-1 TaxID=2999062 RepID=UPI00227E418C|nr:GntR family transcriptional regulator [Brevibacterium sp. BRM-1]WAL39934.1 GntR family transcriptional regulator [Brevibacterium sp. BRM-1]